jgi:DNA replication protein DnaC
LHRALRKLDNFDFLALDDLGYLPQGAAESEVLFTLMAERYERRAIGITSILVFSHRDQIIQDPILGSCEVYH